MATKLSGKIVLWRKAYQASAVPSLLHSYVLPWDFLQRYLRVPLDWGVGWGIFLLPFPPLTVPYSTHLIGLCSEYPVGAQAKKQIHKLCQKRARCYPLLHLLHYKAILIANLNNINQTIFWSTWQNTPNNSSVNICNLPTYRSVFPRRSLPWNLWVARLHQSHTSWSLHWSSPRYLTASHLTT